MGSLGDDSEFKDEDFLEAFAEFDKNKSGTVEKAEMVDFMKRLLNPQPEEAEAAPEKVEAVSEEVKHPIIAAEPVVEETTKVETAKFPEPLVEA